MTYLKGNFDDKNLHLDDLCNLLTKEITELATAEYKLKLMFVLVHIIEESQKALGEINIDNCVHELKVLVNKACEKTKMQMEVQKLRFTQDKQVRDVVDGTNVELIALDKEIEPLLARYENVLQQLVTFKESLSIPERDVAQ